jgi:thiol-disulfide isomerase/thioredoxin
MLDGRRSYNLFRRSALGALALPSLVACAPATPTPAPPVAPTVRVRDVFPDVSAACAVPRQRELSEPPPEIAPEERVPEFLLATEGCQIFDSHDLVGKEPFVVVFFASWCSVCEHRIPLLRDALRERSGQVIPLWISLDDAADGWGETDAFLERHALARQSAVAGREFLGFSLGYNPFRSVPVVVVVGRSGRVVAVQIGVRDGDEDVLERALDAAIAEPPERTLAGETRNPRRVSPNVEEVPNAEMPIWPGSPRPSPAQRGRGEPGTDLGHDALAACDRLTSARRP